MSSSVVFTPFFFFFNFNASNSNYPFLVSCIDYLGYYNLCSGRIEGIDHFKLHHVAPDRDSVSGDHGAGRMPYETDRGTNFRIEDHG